MVRFVWLICLSFSLIACRVESPQSFSNVETEQVQKQSAIEEAYQRKQSNIWVEGEGIVHKILKDDHKGARHQKFLLKTAGDKTLLVAHNIDLAPRIEHLQVGDRVIFRGEYVYNPKGGVIHWTHHDPKNQMVGGWIKHQDQEYK